MTGDSIVISAYRNRGWQFLGRGRLLFSGRIDGFDGQLDEAVFFALEAAIAGLPGQSCSAKAEVEGVVYEAAWEKSKLGQLRARRAAR